MNTSTIKNLSDTELFNKLGSIHEQIEIELQMDGSGECSHFIYEAFQPMLDLIEGELVTRGLLEWPI